MNIFEALEKGEGKATLPEMKVYYAYQNGEDGYIRWLEDKSTSTFKVVMEDLKRNDWTPYNIFIKNPWFKCRCCQDIINGEKVVVDFDQKCIKCGKQFNLVLGKTKTKDKEVKECSNCGNISYPGKVIFITKDDKCSKCGANIIQTPVGNFFEKRINAKENTF